MNEIDKIMMMNSRQRETIRELEEDIRNKDIMLFEMDEELERLRGYEIGIDRIKQDLKHAPMFNSEHATPRSDISITLEGEVIDEPYKD